MILPGYDCGSCLPETQQERGCSLRGVPGPALSRVVSSFCGREQEWRDCPIALRTPEHYGAFRAWQLWRDGRQLWPSIQDAPLRLLRQIEVVAAEVLACQAKLDQEAARG